MSLDTDNPKKVTSVVTIALLFLVPLLAAYAIYFGYGRANLFGDTLNYGVFIEPPEQMVKLRLIKSNGETYPQAALRSKWVLIYFMPDACDASCKDNLYKLRQVRLALGKNMDRLNRMVMSIYPKLTFRLTREIKKDYAGTIHVMVPENQLTQLLQKHIDTDVLLQRGGLFIADPLGNLMMSYPENVKAKELLKDLERLLRVSQIG